jgi:hypothetical protein
VIGKELGMGLYDHKRLAKKLEKSGKRAKAEVLRMVQEASHSTGRYTDDTDVKGSGWLDYHLTLRVMPDGEAPFEAEARTRLYQLPRHGQVFDVLYDPGDHKKIVVDYEGAYDATHGPPGATVVDPELQELERLKAQEASDGPAASGTSPDPLERLQTLADLHDRGALTDAEFATEKAKLLNKS